MYFWVSRAAARIAAKSNRNQSLMYITFVVTIHIFYSRSWAIDYVSENEDLFKNCVPASVPLTMCGFNEYFPSTEGFIL